MADLIFIIIGILFLLGGLAGCIVPVIPGPPIAYLGLLILHFSPEYAFTTQFLLLWAGISIAAALLDNVIPVLGAKKYGGSRAAVWGSAAGLLIGLLLFPPFGIIAGPFIGAVIGELTGGRGSSDALKSGFGTFMGFIGSLLLKLITTGLIIFHFFSKLFQ